MITRGNGDDGHRLVNQRDGAVLHLSGGVALGVDVGNLLQFERPFQCDGVIDAPPQVEEMLPVVEAPGQRIVHLVGLQHAPHQVGEPRQIVHRRPQSLAGQGSTQLAQVAAQ